jgi:hypothetical protein
VVCAHHGEEEHGHADRDRALRVRMTISATLWSLLAAFVAPVTPGMI